MFTLSDPDPRTGRRTVTLSDGRRLSGVAEVNSYVETADRRPNHGEVRHVVMLNMTRHVTEPSPYSDGNRTVYRDADPDADEVNTGDAVIRNPVRVHGIAYTGTLYAQQLHTPEWGAPGGKSGHGEARIDPWRVADVFIDRADHGNVTDAARHVLYGLALAVAKQIGTPSQFHADRIAAARRTMDRALDEVSKANRAYLAATDEYNALTADRPLHAGDTLADQIDNDLVNHATGN